MTVPGRLLEITARSSVTTASSTRRPPPLI
jgi:hypothetical protein